MKTVGNGIKIFTIAELRGQKFTDEQIAEFASRYLHAKATRAEYAKSEEAKEAARARRERERKEREEFRKWKEAQGKKAKVA